MEYTLDELLNMLESGETLPADAQNLAFDALTSVEISEQFRNAAQSRGIDPRAAVDKLRTMTEEEPSSGGFWRRLFGG